MEKLQSLSIMVLQGLAKKEGIDATQNREELIKQLEVALTKKANSSDDTQDGGINESSTWGSITGGNRKENKNYSDAQAYPMSDGLRKWVMDLAKRFRFTEEQQAEMANWSSKQAREFIDEYQYKDIPASDKQLELISKTITEIRTTGQRPNMPESVSKYANFNIPEQVLFNLTGGETGTAGTLIDKLFAINKELRPYRPLSEKQADMIVPWFLCPDVPFEDYGVEKKIGDKLMTPVQFKAEIMAKFTASDASFFIDQYMPIVRQWERTRITDSQIKHIRELESRMADLSVGVKKEWAYNPETGNIEEVIEKREKQYNPIAYEMLPEEVLRQMSREDADNHIKQLKIELSKPVKGTIEASPAQQMLEDKRNEQFSKNSPVDEYSLTMDFTHKLDAVCSFLNDELRDEITELLVHGVGQAKNVTEQLINYMDLAIVGGGSSVAKLIEMANGSEFVLGLIEATYPDKYEEALFGKPSEEKKAQKANNAVNNEVNDFINNL